MLGGGLLGVDGGAGRGTVGRQRGGLSSALA